MVELIQGVLAPSDEQCSNQYLSMFVAYLNITFFFFLVIYYYYIPLAAGNDCNSVAFCHIRTFYGLYYFILGNTMACLFKSGCFLSGISKWPVIEAVSIHFYLPGILA